MMTHEDKQRIELVIIEQTRYETYKKESIKNLEKEIERATLMSSKDIPEDVITMNSRVTLVDEETGEKEDYYLVYPEEADVSENKISILAPVGTAMLGYRVGDIIEWPVPKGVIRYKVEKVLFQPEANGMYHL